PLFVDRVEFLADHHEGRSGLLGDAQPRLSERRTEAAEEERDRVDLIEEQLVPAGDDRKRRKSGLVLVEGLDEDGDRLRRLILEILRAGNDRESGVDEGLVVAIE